MKTTWSFTLAGRTISAAIVALTGCATLLTLTDNWFSPRIASIPQTEFAQITYEGPGSYPNRYSSIADLKLAGGIIGEVWVGENRITRKCRPLEDDCVPDDAYSELCQESVSGPTAPEGRACVYFKLLSRVQEVKVELINGTQVKLSWTAANDRMQHQRVAAVIAYTPRLPPQVKEGVAYKITQLLSWIAERVWNLRVLGM